MGCYTKAETTYGDSEVGRGHSGGTSYDVTWLGVLKRSFLPP